MSDLGPVSITHLRVQPGDVVIFWLPEGFSNHLQEHVRECAQFLRQHHPLVVPLVMPGDGTTIGTLPAEEAQEMLRSSLQAIEACGCSWESKEERDG